MHIQQARRLAAELASRAHTPYSNRNDAVVLILSDGSWIPGVRVESASFSLTIPALLNAVTTAYAGGRADIAAVVASRPLRNEERVALEAPPFDRLIRVANDCYRLEDGPFPTPLELWDPALPGDAIDSPQDGIRRARDVARAAYVPESDFPVGCVIETESGAIVPGVNVEHSDWSRVLCAERSALGTVVSYSLGSIRALYLSCTKDPLGTPCGACRQLIAELAPQSTLWMDRGIHPPASSDPSTLLPGSFTGTSIRKKP